MLEQWTNSLTRSHMCCPGCTWFVVFFCSTSCVNFSDPAVKIAHVISSLLSSVLGCCWVHTIFKHCTCRATVWHCYHWHRLINTCCGVDNWLKVWGLWQHEQEIVNDHCETSTQAGLQKPRMKPIRYTTSSKDGIFSKNNILLKQCVGECLCFHVVRPAGFLQIGSNFAC